MVESRKVMWAAAMMNRPLQERLDAVAESGFTGMSIFPADMRRWRREGLKDSEITRMIGASGVKIVALDPFTGWAPGWNVEGLDQETRDFIDFSEDDIWRMAEVIDAEAINAVQSVGDDYELSAYSEALAGFSERARAHGRRVAVEFMPICNIPDLQTGWDLIRTAGDDLGMVFDTWHFWRSDPDHALLQTIPGDRILEVQIADAKTDLVGDLMEDLMQHRQVPGEGEFNLSKTVGVLKAIRGLKSYGPETFSNEMNKITAREAVQQNEAGMKVVIAQARDDVN